VDRLVFAEVFAGELVDVLPVDDRAEEFLKEFVLAIGPLVVAVRPRRYGAIIISGICR